MNKLTENISSQEIPHKTTPLPEFSYDKITDIMKRIEQNGRPRNLNEAMTSWTKILEQHMKYDAINFAIFRTVPLDEEQGDFSDKIKIESLGLSKEQIKVLRKLFTDLKKETEKSGDFVMLGIIDGIIQSIDNDIISVIKNIMDSPSLQRYLLEDGLFAKQWHSLYEKKNISQLLNQGIGSCKTLSIMSKMILESANIRYGLGIKRIEIIEDSGFHVFLRIYTHKGIEEYDPTSIFYKSSFQKKDLNSSGK